jgi:hypothetical protein
MKGLPVEAEQGRRASELLFGPSKIEASPPLTGGIGRLANLAVSNRGKCPSNQIAFCHLDENTKTTTTGDYGT